MENPKSAVILLSRQNLRPSLSDEWVRRLVQSTKFINSKDHILLSSTGTPNWEIVTACASIHRVKLKLIVPLLKDEDKKQTRSNLESEFALDTNSLKTCWLQTKEIRKLNEIVFKRRDEMIVREADVLIPISIRPNGYLSQLIRHEEELGKEIVSDFAVEYQSTNQKLSYSIDQSKLSNEIKQLNRDYIIHWTRATNVPWPEERRFDFYSDILKSTEYPRTALATLMRIIDSKRICGTSKNMPDKAKTVSWSGLDPIDTIKLMRWRSRFRRMSFEPYGIGIKREAALAMSIQPVQYYDPKKEKFPKSVPKWLTQSTGRVSDWSYENEFRYNGDFDLTTIPIEMLIAVTHKKSDALELEKRFGVKTIWFCN